MIITGYGNYEGLGLLSLSSPTRTPTISVAPKPTITTSNVSPTISRAISSAIQASSPTISSSISSGAVTAAKAAESVLPKISPLITSGAQTISSGMQAIQPRLATSPSISPSIAPSLATQPTPTLKTSPTLMPGVETTLKSASTILPFTAPSSGGSGALAPPPPAPSQSVQMNVPTGLSIPGSSQPIGYRAPSLPIPTGGGFSPSAGQVSGRGGAGAASLITAALMPQFGPGQTPTAVTPSVAQPCPPGTLPGKAPGQCFPKDLSSMTPQEAAIAQQMLYSPTGAYQNPMTSAQTLSTIPETNGEEEEPQEEVAPPKKSLLLPLAIGGAALLALKFLR